MSKSCKEKFEKNTTHRMKNAYEMNSHDEKMILQYLKKKLKKNREII